MKYQLTIIALVICSTLFAQTEQVAVMEPINNLFNGMNKGDSAMIHKAFMADATMGSVSTDETGNPVFKKGSVQRFLNGMGTPHKEVYSEPIWDVKIDIDGNLAQVWARYAFYLDKTFHHCGVDAFQLFKGKDGWKIFQLVDTRQTENCDIPKAIQDRFK